MATFNEFTSTYYDNKNDGFKMSFKKYIETSVNKKKTKGGNSINKKCEENLNQKECENSKTQESETVQKDSNRVEISDTHKKEVIPEITCNETEISEPKNSVTDSTKQNTEMNQSRSSQRSIERDDDTQRI